MDFQIVERNDAIWVEMTGALDAAGTHKAREVAGLIMESGAASVTLDWTKLDFLDPSGVGLLVYLFKRLSRKDRRLRVLGVNGQPGRLLRQLKFDNALNIAFLPDERPAFTNFEEPVAAYGAI